MRVVDNVSLVNNPPFEAQGVRLEAVYADGPPMWVGPELWMNSPSRVVSDQDDYRVSVSVDRTGDTIGVTRLEVTARATGERIDSDTVRSISFREAFRSATLHVVNWSPSGVTFDRFPISSVLTDLRNQIAEPVSGRYRLPAGDDLRKLVAVVRAARLLGAGPGTMLRQDLGLPSTTARYWVERIKTLGLLGVEQ